MAEETKIKDDNDTIFGEADPDDQEDPRVENTDSQADDVTSSSPIESDDETDEDEDEDEDEGNGSFEDGEGLAAVFRQFGYEIIETHVIVEIDEADAEQL